jgi:hypothetical protein
MLRAYFERMLSKGEWLTVAELIPRQCNTGIAVSMLLGWLHEHRRELEVSCSFIGCVSDDRRWYKDTEGRRHWLIDGVITESGDAIRVVRRRADGEE